ncbi:hypothetical protein, partial [Xylella fastidiosa]|uniref:hypothetical protein n=1 Tax=Xylella fastidiosa TaxID=2371 RepID=UPI001EEBA840
TVPRRTCTVLQCSVRGSRTFQAVGQLDPQIKDGRRHVGLDGAAFAGPYEPTLDNIYRLTPHSMFGVCA